MIILAQFAQAGDKKESPEKSSEREKSIRKSKKKLSVASNQSFNLNNFQNQYIPGLSPPNMAYVQVSEGQEPLETYSANTPMTYDVGGMFGINLNDDGKLSNYSKSIYEGQENCINIRSSLTNFHDTASKPHKVDIIDWSESQIFQMVLEGDIELNKSQSNKFFTYEEIEYIVHMMKKRYRDFKSTSALMPFFKKGKNTLEMLMASLDIPHIYDKVDRNYAEITLENCFKVLIRCKMCFEARQQLSQILEDIAAHEILLCEVFDKIENHLESSTDEEEREELRRKGETLTFYAHRIVKNIRIFQRDHKVFGSTFVFNNRKIDSNIRREIGELRKLLQLYELYISETNPKEMVPKPDISKYRELPKKKRYAKYKS